MQVTAYYAPQFEALREMVVEGGAPVYTACLTRCKKWLSRGGKSAVYFAKTQDERYIVKQLTRSEKQSFLDFAPAYFRCCPALACCLSHIGCYMATSARTLCIRSAHVFFVHQLCSLPSLAVHCASTPTSLVSLAMP